MGNKLYMDETGELYESIRFLKGSMLSFLNPFSIPRNVKSMVRGLIGVRLNLFGLGKNILPGKGDMFHLGGALIVHNDEIIYRYESKGPGDHPKLKDLSKYLSE